MSSINIRVLKDRACGSTVLVVASGASVQHIPPRVFASQIVVAVNEMWQHVPATFIVCHHHERLQEAIDAEPSRRRVVTSSVDLGLPGFGQPCQLTGDFYIYNAKPYAMSLTPSIDVQALEQDTTDSLVTSACTTSEALQFAAHLVGKDGTILCCGLDGAALDGQWCVPGYNVDHTGQSAQVNPQHVRLTNSIVLQMVKALRRKGLAVLSLDPFVGADHEGHRYQPAPVLTGQALLDALRTTHYPRETVTA